MKNKHIQDVNNNNTKSGQAVVSPKEQLDFEEPYLKSIDDELTDIVLLMKKCMIKDIIKAIYRE